jgi:hypothetical protein
MGQASMTSGLSNMELAALSNFLNCRARKVLRGSEAGLQLPPISSLRQADQFFDTHPRYWP